MIEGSTVLVTGAGGSIGSEICRQLSGLKPAKIVMLGHSELPIYNISSEVKGSVPVIADIRDLSRMRDVFIEHRPDYVYHTAAIKHLPYAQMYPAEAVKTNVIGTRNVAIASGMVGARMVMVSTDKAVEPSCVMGQTKRIAELYCGTLDNVMIVRLGNVMESSGSVIPLFKKQIANGGPVTVTHPEMRRYFMEIEDAADLIIQAGKQHAIFGCNLIIKKMQTRLILDIAKDLIGDLDIEVVFTGLRPGEKLDEALFWPTEGIYLENHQYYSCILNKRDNRTMNQVITDLEKGDLSALDTFEYTNKELAAA